VGLRRPGDSYSDVILRLVELGAMRAHCASGERRQGTLGTSSRGQLTSAERRGSVGSLFPKRRIAEWPMNTLIAGGVLALAAALGGKPGARRAGLSSRPVREFARRPYWAALAAR
jgi:hypothetical protein